MFVDLYVPHLFLLLDINMKRKGKGEFHHLVKELEEHPDRYEMHFRMTKEEFNFYMIL